MSHAKTAEYKFRTRIRNDANAVVAMWAAADNCVPVGLRAEFAGWGVDAIAFKCGRCQASFDEDPGHRKPADVTCSECYADADQLFITKVRWSGFCLAAQGGGL